MSFLIGCSISFEDAVAQAGIPPGRVVPQRNVAMYPTNVTCTRAGRFAGERVVSMRPVRSRAVARMVAISGRFPQGPRQADACPGDDVRLRPEGLTLCLASIRRAHLPAAPY